MCSHERASLGVCIQTHICVGIRSVCVGICDVCVGIRSVCGCERGCGCLCRRVDAKHEVRSCQVRSNIGIRTGVSSSFNTRVRISPRRRDRHGWSDGASSEDDGGGRGDIGCDVIKTVVISRVSTDVGRVSMNVGRVSTSVSCIGDVGSSGSISSSGSNTVRNSSGSSRRGIDFMYGP